MLSTGQIFFIAGVIGLVVTTIAAGISIAFMRIKGKRLREEIWKKYR